MSDRAPGSASSTECSSLVTTPSRSPTPPRRRVRQAPATAATRDGRRNRPRKPPTLRQGAPQSKRRVVLWFSDGVSVGNIRPEPPVNIEVMQPNIGVSIRTGMGTGRRWTPYSLLRTTMIEPKTAYPKRNPGASPHTTSAFERPTWAPRPLGLSDSSPRVNTGELVRPFKSGDSMPHISTGDLLRPLWARGSGSGSGLGQSSAT